VLGQPSGALRPTFVVRRHPISRTNCGDEARLLCGVVEKPTDSKTPPCFVVTADARASAPHALGQRLFRWKPALLGWGRFRCEETLRYWEHESEAQMNTMPGPTQSEFFVPSFLLKPLVEASIHPADLKNDQFQNGRPSFGKRAALAFARLLIASLIGIAAAVAWRTYGDAARHLIAPAASTPDQQHLKAMSLDLDAVRRSIDGLAIRIGTSIATSQEQTTRSVDKLTAGLEQMTREIAKLQAVEQYVLYKNSDPPPQQAPPQVPKPVPRPSQGPIVR
jgi:hypothetical protein